MVLAPNQRLAAESLLWIWELLFSPGVFRQSAEAPSEGFGVLILRAPFSGRALHVSYNDWRALEEDLAKRHSMGDTSLKGNTEGLFLEPCCLPDFGAYLQVLAGCCCKAGIRSLKSFSRILKHPKRETAKHAELGNRLMMWLNTKGEK